jgi:hypothetical protein
MGEASPSLIRKGAAATLTRFPNTSFRPSPRFSMTVSDVHIERAGGMIDAEPVHPELDITVRLGSGHAVGQRLGQLEISLCHAYPFVTFRVRRLIRLPASRRSPSWVSKRGRSSHLLETFRRCACRFSDAISASMTTEVSSAIVIERSHSRVRGWQS